MTETYSRARVGKNLYDRFSIRNGLKQGDARSPLLTVKKNAEVLVAATKEIGLDVNPHKTKYMTVSRDQNAGRSHSMKMYNNSIERVEEFKYLGTTLTNQNSTSIQEEIKCRLKLGNACYYSVQNLLSSTLLCKTLKIL